MFDDDLTTRTTAQVGYLSTSTAIQFLNYLTNISNFEVPIIYVEIAADVLTGFYGNTHSINITHSWFSTDLYPVLKVQRKKELTTGAGMSALAKGDKNRFNFEMNYGTSRVTLSHEEIFGRAAENLQKLRIDMGEKPSRRRDKDKNAIFKGSYVDNIFQDCPNLQHLTLVNTFLITYKFGLPVKEGLQGGKVRLIQAFIGPDYLPRLSARCRYLEVLDFSRVTFVCRNGARVRQPRNITIDMPSTQFREIKWRMDQAAPPISNFFLKADTSERNEVLHFHGFFSTLNECSEDSYQ